jgi:hypothetical protein
LLLLASTLCLTANLAAQQPAPSAPASPPSEIVVDGDCRIVTLDLRDPAKPREHHRSDSAVCNLGSGIHESTNWEKTILNGVSKDRRFEVNEREYVLHNPYPQRVTFVVQQHLDKNYRVNSDPQPNSITNSVATFRVFAEANQTIRLHVGERYP